MELPSRKLPRLKGYDYAAQGYYYITICAHDKENIFGWVGNGLDRTAVHLSKIGKIAEEELLEIPTRYDGVRIDDYIVMPNHIHLILILGCDLAERSRPFPTVSEIIGLYKLGREPTDTRGNSVSKSNLAEILLRYCFDKRATVYFRSRVHYL